MTMRMKVRRSRNRRTIRTTHPIWATETRNGIGETRTAPGGILSCRAEPLKDQSNAHDHVAEHHDRVVKVFAVFDRREHPRHAERQDQHADHLHHGDEAEDPVVGVVSRSEPREVGPRPADAEAREGETEQGRLVVALRQRMRELRGGQAEGYDERQVEQQFKRRGDAVRLVTVTSAHTAGVMMEAVDDSADYSCGSS